MLKVIWGDLRGLFPVSWRGLLYAMLGLAGCALVALLGLCAVCLLGSPAYVAARYWIGWSPIDSVTLGMWSGIGLFILLTYLGSVRERIRR